MLDNFVFWQKLEDFASYYFPIVDRFPKYEKFALCGVTKNQVYEIMRKTIKTNKSKSKNGWYEIDCELEFLRFLLRHAHERKYLSGKSLETGAKKLDELGRLVGGLIKGFGCQQRQPEQRRELRFPLRQREQRPMELEREHRVPPCL